MITKVRWHLLGFALRVGCKINRRILEGNNIWIVQNLHVISYGSNDDAQPVSFFYKQTTTNFDHREFLHKTTI